MTQFISKVCRALRAGRWPLSLKYTLTLLLAALLPMLLVAYGNLQSGLAGVAQTERDNLALVAQGLSGQLDQLIEGHGKLARLLGEDRDVQAFLQAATTAREALAAPVGYRIGLLMAAYPELSSLYLMDVEGQIVAASDPALLGLRRQFRRYFTEARAGRVHASNLLMGLNTGEPGVYFSAPVRSAGDELLGVAVVKLKGAAVEAVLDDPKGELQAWLVDQDGVVISHPDPGWLYRSLRALDPARIAAIQAESQFPVTTLAPVQAGGLEPVLDMTGPGSLDFVQADGRRWMAGVAPMQQQAWRVVLAEPESRFAAHLHGLFQRSLLTMAGSAVLVALLAWLLGRTLSRPMLRLAAAAADMKAGRYVQALSQPGLETVQARQDELGLLARTFREMGQEIHEREEHLDRLVQDRTRELADKNRLLQATYARLDQDLVMARDMQQAVLPQEFPSDPRWQVCASMRPAREMGGDFYDCIALGDGRYGLVVADVSGKGVAAAFFMAITQTVLQARAFEQSSPAAVLAQANDVLCARNPMELFVTVFYGVFDPADGSFRYACAGHNPPLLRRASGGVEALVVDRDPALGVLPGLQYGETCRVVQPGETLLLYTDGITEALSPAGEEFGLSRLQAWLAGQEVAGAGALCGGLSASLEAFVADAEPFDDQTLLILQRAAEPVLEVRHWTLMSRLDEIGRLAEEVEDFLCAALKGESQAQSRLAFQLNVCLDELLTNIIEHGLKGAPDRRIEVGLSLGRSWLEVRLQDDAPPFDSFAQPVPDLTLGVEDRPIGGLGVQFVRTLMDDYVWRPVQGGNLIVLRKRLAAGSPASQEDEEDQG